MTSARPVIFWWVTPSIHMEPCMRAFADLWPGRTLAVWCAPLSPERQALGWRAPQLGSMPQLALPAEDEAAQAEIERIVAELPSAVHLYSGWKGNPRGYSAFKAARGDAEARHVVVAEPFRGWGVRRYTRHARALLMTLPYRGQLDAILAIGEAGASFYRSVGFSSKILLPFIYQSPSGRATAAGACSNPLRFVYVGKFDLRKGLQDLLRALGRLRQLPWTLSIIGDGPRRPELERLSRSLGIDRRLDWQGVMSHDALVGQLPSYDAAVVPSRFDGWGVVTNEALQAGLAVVVSERASSNDLVRYSGAGLVFRAGDWRALADSLSDMINQPGRIVAMKSRAVAYQDRISGGAVARYLTDVLKFISGDFQGMRPMAPWISSTCVGQ